MEQPECMFHYWNSPGVMELEGSISADWKWEELWMEIIDGWYTDLIMSEKHITASRDPSTTRLLTLGYAK